jgi:AraC family transcriptional activator of pyochelin receptor
MLPHSDQIRTEPRTVPVRRFPPPAKNAAQVSVRFALDDYAAELTKYRAKLAEDFSLLSDSHYRLRMKEGFDLGQYEFCGLADGFFNAPVSVF